MVKLLHKSKSTKRQPLPLSSHPSHLKTRALLPRIQLPMAYDQRLRKPLLQLPDQGRQADLLRLRPRVLCTALRVQPAFVADADAVTVVVATVHPHHDMHDATPNTPARAVATVTIILSTRLHTFFFFVVVSLTLLMDN